MNIDFIGDIHGHAGALERLLEKLGYERFRSGYKHPKRKVLFLGDYIDRGPQQLEVLNIVRSMTDSGHALALMGNHELNAIGWMTPSVENTGEFLRPRNGEKGAKNRNQHQAFLDQVGEDSATHHEWVDWFKSLPLWIETEQFVAVHACWSPSLTSHLDSVLSTDKCLRADGLQSVFSPGHATYEAIETLLKGLEVDLPSGVGFADKDGHYRTKMRVKWWECDAATYKDAYIGPPGVDIPNSPMPDDCKVEPDDRKIFFGHYWLNPKQGVGPMTRKAACLDYSVAKGGLLAAYRDDGLPNLSVSNFVTAGSMHAD